MEKVQANIRTEPDCIVPAFNSSHKKRICLLGREESEMALWSQLVQEVGVLPNEEKNGSLFQE